MYNKQDSDIDLADGEKGYGLGVEGGLPDKITGRMNHE